VKRLICDVATATPYLRRFICDAFRLALSFAAVRKIPLLLALVLLALAAGCARMPTGVTQLKAARPSELRQVLLNSKADVDQFRLRGPFEEDRALGLSATERIAVDWYLAAPAEKAPLVILLHGHDNTKEDHSYQALHLATWGVHSVTVQLPNQGPWADNGRTLARIVAAVRRRPEGVDSRIDVDRIILAGHSFGGAAVTVALAEGAPVVGGILLDPAVPGKEFPRFLRRVSKPVMMIGADEYFSPVANRGDFFRHIRKGIAEISITGAHHDDAQFALGAPEDPESTSTEEHQVTFVSALTAAALSLAGTGNLDYAWRSFSDGLASGRFSKAMKK
jgi:pimeloyl-ACP methyl ester carboxylesterase